MVVLVAQSAHLENITSNWVIVKSKYKMQELSASCNIILGLQECNASPVKLQLLKKMTASSLVPISAFIKRYFKN